MRRIINAAAVLAVMALFTMGGSSLAGACGAKGAGACCGSAKSIGMGACCGGKSAKVSTALPGSDFFLDSYLSVKKGLLDGSGQEAEKAVQAWKTGVKALAGSGKALESEAEMKSLVAILDAWPSNIDSQRSSFEDLSEWTIHYVKSFPERCPDAQVKTCPISGHRWVQTPEASGNPYSG